MRSTKRLWGRIIASVLLIATVQVFAGNLGTDDDNTAADSSSCPTPEGPDCINVVINFDKYIHDDSAIRTYFQIYSEKPSPSIFTPSGLRFNNHLLDRKMLSASEDEVSIRMRKGSVMKFEFISGQSVAFPVGDQSTMTSRIYKVDTAGELVAENAAYLYWVFKDTSKYVFDAKSLKQQYAVLANGRKVTQEDNQFTTVYDDNNLVRQVKGPNYLADIVIDDELGYHINIYHNDDVSESVNSEGFYIVAGLPVTEHVIENASGTSTVLDRFKHTRRASGTDYPTTFDYYAANDQWVMNSGDGLYIEDKVKYTNGGATIETYTIQDAQNHIAEVKKEVFTNIDGGKLIGYVIVNGV